MEKDMVGSASRMTRRELLRRGAGLFALGALGAPVLAACTGGESESAREGTQEQVTIQYWHTNTESFGLPAVREIVKKFEEQNPNITVRPRTNKDYTALLQKVQSSIASGDAPDVAQVGYLFLDYVGNNFQYAPIEELASTYAKDDFLGNFPDNILELGQTGGKQAGMPYAVSNPVMFYNGDMLSESGVDAENPPQTWEEWRQAAQSIKDATGNPGIYIQIFGDNWCPQAMIESNGGKLLACQGEQYQAVFDSPEAVEAMDFWAGLIEDGLALNVLLEQAEQAFLSQNVATYITSISARANLEEQASFDLRATTFPHFGNKEVQLPTGGNNLFVFSKEEAKKRAAWAFVEYLESPEALTIWVKGTGYLPPREGVADDPQYLGDFMESNPIQQVAVEQIQYALPWVAFPGNDSLQASETLFKAVQQTLGGQQSAEQALSGAAEKVNSLIEGQGCSS